MWMKSARELAGLLRLNSRAESLMRRYAPLRLAPACCLLLATVVAIADDGKGWFGFAANIDVDGMLRPTVQSIRIDTVVAGSPAASQGLATGDYVVEAEGLAVPGCNARELQARMEKHVGETLHLRLKRTSGEVYSANLVAAAKSKS